MRTILVFAIILATGLAAGGPLRAQSGELAPDFPLQDRTLEGSPEPGSLLGPLAGGLPATPSSDRTLTGLAPGAAADPTETRRALDGARKRQSALEQLARDLDIAAGDVVMLVNAGGGGREIVPIVLFLGQAGVAPQAELQKLVAARDTTSLVAKIRARIQSLREDLARVEVARFRLEQTLESRPTAPPGR